jgi:DNA-binding response OmpR family regulator
MKLILLEDERLILLCAQDALTAAGFEVIPATNGEEALQLLPQTADCVLMMFDVRLGGELNGWEVARRARKVQPDLAIVYTTTAEWSGLSTGERGPQRLAAEALYLGSGSQRRS